MYSFRRKIRAFYREHGRSLPFRQTRDPYRIAVAEIMLQQTQVERVVPRYDSWIARWPAWSALAEASSRQLLAAWSGLGYNRRALFLREMARVVIARHGGILPDDPAALIRLPGIGPYTSRAIPIFAYNKPFVAVDINIRRVLIHELQLPPSTTPRQLESVALQLLPRKQAREWHYALMDYSALALPRQLGTVRPLARQKAFDGSIRQIRGEIIRRLTTRRQLRTGTIARVLSRSAAEVERAVAGLEKDGLVVRKAKTVYLKE